MGSTKGQKFRTRDKKGQNEDKIGTNPKKVVKPMSLKDYVKVSKVAKLKFQKHDLETNHSNIGGGIYRFFDEKGEVIYVGKSNNLHRRLHQHFGKDTNTAYFIDEVKSYEVFVENDPVLQTLLEGIFIAYHQPKYNDEVKDKERMNEHI